MKINKFTSFLRFRAVKIKLIDLKYRSIFLKLGGLVN